MSVSYRGAALIWPIGGSRQSLKACVWLSAALEPRLVR